MMRRRREHKMGNNPARIHQPGDMLQLAKPHRPGQMLIVICIMCALVTAGIAEPVHAASYSFKSTTIYADGTRTARFTCNGMTGLCCEAGAYSTYSGTATLSRMKNTSNAAHCAYYYGYQKGWTTKSNGHKLARLLSYCMGHGTGGDYKASTMKSLLATAKKKEVPAGFECWHCKPKGSSKQDFIVWKFPKGKLQVVKQSGDTGVTQQGTYTLTGMTIGIYSDADCKNCVKTLTTKKDGTTGGAFSLPVGTYYVKETVVPEETGYVQNETVYPITIKSGKTGKVTVKNMPALGSIGIRKFTTGEGGAIEGFRFLLTGKKSGKEYVLVTGPDGTAKVADLPFGSYTLSEDLTEEQERCYTDRTGVQTITIAGGGATSDVIVDRENAFEPIQKLKILKRTGDGGPAGGFAFRISWLLSNSKLIAAEKIVAAADPQVELSDGQSLGIWQIADPETIETINADAAKGQTGTYEVVLRNTVTTEKKTAGAAEVEDDAGGKGAAEINGEADGAAAEQSAAETGTETSADHAEGSNEADQNAAEDAGQSGAAGKNAAQEDSGAAEGDPTAEMPEGSGEETMLQTSDGDGVITEEIEVRIPIELTAVTESIDEEAGRTEETEPEEPTETEAGEQITSAAPETVEKGNTAEAASESNTAEVSDPILRAMPEPLTQVDEIKTQSGGFTVRCRALRFAGAADKGEETVTTNAAGQYISDHVLPGTYTVTEEMTDRQKLRYRRPAAQKKVVEMDSEETIVFTFRNDPIRMPVKLQKASADGAIENIEFTVSGTPDYAEEPMEEITVRTGSDGIADLGMLYPGTYTVEETGFDETRYANAYPMEGKDRPAFAFTITGEELTDEEISAGGTLWLGGEPGDGGISKEPVSFRNTPYVDLWITKVDGVSRSFLPGAAFALEDSKGETAAQFRIDADQEGQPEGELLKTNGTLAIAGTEVQEAGKSVVIGADTTETAADGATEAEGTTADNAVTDETAAADSAAETDGTAVGEAATTDEAEPALEYPCIVLRGLVEGEQYTLTEIAAPEGFTPLEKPYRFSVELNEAGEPVLNTCDEYGKNITAAVRQGTLVVVNDAPSIGTEALNESTGDHNATAEGEVTLIDNCRITNLAAGETYTLIARLMDTTGHTSGRTDDVTQISDADGPVTGRITFTAKAREETVKIPLQLKGSGLGGKRTVVYESLYQGEVPLAEVEQETAISEETDPDNEKQMIVFDIPETPRSMPPEKENPKPPGKDTPDTGDTFPWMVPAVLTAVSGLLAQQSLRRIRRRQRQEC